MIGKYLPDHLPDNDNIVEYVYEIIENMGDNKPLFIDAIMLLSGKTLEELDRLDTIQRIEIFVHGFADNQVLAFKEFVESIGLNG